MNIERRTQYLADVVMDSTLADATAIQIEEFASGVFAMTSGTTATVTFYVSDSKTGTFRVMHDSSNNAISRTITDEKAYQIPAECFGAPWLKILGNADGVCQVYLKT